MNKLQFRLKLILTLYRNDGVIVLLYYNYWEIKTSHNIIWISFDNWQSSNVQIEFDEITMNKQQFRLKLIIASWLEHSIIVIL